MKQQLDQEKLEKIQTQAQVHELEEKIKAMEEI